MVRYGKVRWVAWIFGWFANYRDFANVLGIKWLMYCVYVKVPSEVHYMHCEGDP